MLKPRLPQSPPPPQSRVRIGDFVVDLSAREVIASVSAVRTRITSKALAVLVELAVNPGQVLSRDELMDRVWVGVFPTGDVLTQAITTLRKAFGDSAESPSYIETISKSGYRLIAAVQWLRTEPEAVTTTDTAPMLATQVAQAVPSLTFAPAAAPRGARARWMAVAGAALVLAAVGWLWQQRSDSTRALVNAAALGADKPLVVVAGEGDEWGARLSPDGAMMVYVAADRPGASARLFLQAPMLATPTALTQPSAREQDLLPTWSPDGRSIVFQRHSEEAECKFMEIAGNGGLLRELGPCPADVVLLYDWAPDGSHLVIGGVYDEKRSAHVVQRFDIATGKLSAIDYDAPAGSLDLEPRYSPDGRWLVFRRNLSSADLWRIPSTGGMPQRLTRIATDIRGFDWAPDSRHIVFSMVTDGDHALWSLDTQTSAMQPLGIENATFPDFPLRSNELVFDVARGQTGLARVDLRSADAPAERILASSASELNGEIAPDQSALAFYSDRSGKAAVWVAPVASDVGTAQVVPGLMPMLRFNPEWSADSRRFLVIGFGDKGAGVYEIDRGRLRATALDVGFAAPRFADYLDASHLLVGGIVDAQQSMWVVERQGDTLMAQQRIDGVSYARVAPGQDRIFFTRIGQPGLWEADRSLEKVHAVFSAWPSIGGYKLWNFSGSNLQLIRSAAGPNDMEYVTWQLERLNEAPEWVRHLGESSAMTFGNYTQGQIILTENYGNGRDIAVSRYHPHAADQ